MGYCRWMSSGLTQRTYPPLWRVAAAFILVPALAAFLLAIPLPLYEGLPSMPERIWRSALIYAVVGAYPPAAIFGIPAYFFFRGRVEPNVVNCGLVGAVVAALPWVFVAFFSSPDQASIGSRATVIDGSKTTFGWFMDVVSFGEIALIGAFGGALFWVIAAAGSGAGKVRSDA